MSRPNRGHFYSSLCTHNRTVFCQEQGSEVCLDCALVIEDRLPLLSTTCTNIPEEKCHFLSELSEKLHLPQTFRDEAENIYKLIKQEIEDKGMKCVFKKEEVMCFAIYECICRLDIGTTPHEVAFYGEIEIDKLWAIEKVLDIHTTRQCLSVYTAKLSYALNLDFHHETRIRRICQRLYGLAHHKPTNLFAAVVKLYCKANNIKLIFSHLCSMLNCTASSVNKIIHDIGRKGVDINVLAE